VALSTTSRKRLLSGPLIKAASWGGGRGRGMLKVSLNNVSLDDPSGILYPLDFVSFG
jgi:hypothetical protein